MFGASAAGLTAALQQSQLQGAGDVPLPAHRISHGAGPVRAVRPSPAPSSQSIHLHRTGSITMSDHANHSMHSVHSTPQPSSARAAGRMSAHSARPSRCVSVYNIGNGRCAEKKPPKPPISPRPPYFPYPLLTICKCISFSNLRFSLPHTCDTTVRPPSASPTD